MATQKLYSQRKRFILYKTTREIKIKTCKSTVVTFDLNNNLARTVETT